MNRDAKIAFDFIKTTLDDYHEFYEFRLKYTESFVTGLSLIYEKLGILEFPITLSVATNYRDCFWHYVELEKSYKNIINPIDLSNEEYQKFFIQYELLLEHYNRAVLDSFIDLNQQIARVYEVLSEKQFERCKENKKQENDNTISLKRLQSIEDICYCAKEILSDLRKKRQGHFLIIAHSQDYGISSSTANNTLMDEIIDKMISNDSKMKAILF